jgi:hypothetical protein
LLLRSEWIGGQRDSCKTSGLRRLEEEAQEEEEEAAMELFLCIGPSSCCCRCDSSGSLFRSFIFFSSWKRRSEITDGVAGTRSWFWNPELELTAGAVAEGCD